MDVVALTTLATSVDVEAPLLADDLGLTVYEARQKLALLLPAVVLMSPDRERTTSLLAALRRRGHGAIACDARAVAPSGRMTVIRRFHLELDALVLEGTDGDPAAERVPFADMVALIRAAHRHSTLTHEQTKEKKFRPAAALITGGVVLTKTVKKDVVRTGEEKEQVLYIFRRGGQLPCLLREGSAQYGGLGQAVQPTRLLNFATTVRLLREGAPRVPCDERLVTMKKAPEPPNAPGTPRLFDRETGGTDLMAHLLAMVISAP